VSQHSELITAWRHVLADPNTPGHNNQTAVDSRFHSTSVLPHGESRGVVGRGHGGTASPHFLGLKFMQKLVHCCNWLLTETQCKIISVQQN